jgi:two-component system phosphate regulon response regulator PhoB
MHVVVLAHDVRLAALVKERFDSRQIGVTEVVRVDDARVCELVQHLRPGVFISVSRRIDSVTVDVCRRLGQSPATNQVPLIVAAEQASEVERITVLEAGADSVVEPLDLDRIEQRLHASCRRTSIYRAYRDAGLFIGAEGSSVSVCDRPVTLTPIEARVLRVLVHQCNRAVRRCVLEQSIWGATRSRTLDVHIARLRRKLGPAGRRIETVTKVGFRYVEPL